MRMRRGGCCCRGSRIGVWRCINFGNTTGRRRRGPKGTIYEDMFLYDDGHAGGGVFDRRGWDGRAGGDRVWRPGGAGGAGRGGGEVGGGGAGGGPSGVCGVFCRREASVGRAVGADGIGVSGAGVGGVAGDPAGRDAELRGIGAGLGQFGAGGGAGERDEPVMRGGAVSSCDRGGWVAHGFRIWHDDQAVVTRS